MSKTAVLSQVYAPHLWMAIGLFAVIGVALADRAAHPSVVIMNIDGQQVESRVLGYGRACSGGEDFSTPGGMSESPVRDFSR